MVPKPYYPSSLFTHTLSNIHSTGRRSRLNAAKDVFVTGVFLMRDAWKKQKTQTSKGWNVWRGTWKSGLFVTHELERRALSKMV